MLPGEGASALLAQKAWNCSKLRGRPPSSRENSEPSRWQRSRHQAGSLLAHGRLLSEVHTVRAGGPSGPASCQDPPG